LRETFTPLSTQNLGSGPQRLFPSREIKEICGKTSLSKSNKMAGCPFLMLFNTRVSIFVGKTPPKMTGKTILFPDKSLTK
jgi:hypothetical protein